MTAILVSMRLLALGTLSLLLLGGCDRDFAPSDAGVHVDPDDAGADARVEDSAPSYLDIAQTQRDRGPGDTLRSFVDCGVELERDGGGASAASCEANSDWACGRGCGETGRLLCLGAGGALQREIRCMDDGACYCHAEGSWRPCDDTNTGRLGCIRAREALVAGCCKP